MRTPRGQLVRIDASDLDPRAEATVASTASGRDAIVRKVARGQLCLRDAVEDLKFAAITCTLQETSGNWAEAARRLGMDRSNLHHMAHRLGVTIGGG